MMKQEPVIAIKNLNHYYGKGALRKQILFDINLEIYSGEIVIMTGPSGSGKTTLLSLIGGLRSVQEGSLKFLGEELVGVSQSKLVQMRRQIGYIFQAHNLLGFLTAKQNVQMAVELNNHISKTEAVAKSKAMLGSVGLEERVDYYPDNLSGGQKQRIAIARTLLTDYSILILDDSTSAVDAKTAAQIQAELDGLMHQKACTTFVVAQRISTVKNADRIFLMDKGRLVAQGTHEELMQTSPLYGVILESQVKPKQKMISS